MVRVVLHRAEIQIATLKAGRKLVKEVLAQTARRARVRAAAGPYATGRLASSIRERGPYMAGDTVRGQVGSVRVYAASVESGAKPHLILPHGDYPLRFFWRKVGHVVRLPRVNHPGQKAKHYLRDSLREVAEAHNMRMVP